MQIAADLLCVALLCVFCDITTLNQCLYLPLLLVLLCWRVVGPTPTRSIGKMHSQC